MVEIIDDYLSPRDFNHIQKMILHPGFPWHYNDSVNFEGDGKVQFIHSLYKMYEPQSPYFKELGGLLSRLSASAIVRMKLNLLPKATEIIEHGYHIDTFNYPEGMKTGILYINGNDGYTGFKDGTKVESVPNRFVSFDGGMPHTGTTSTNARRVVLNINYMEEGPIRDREGKDYEG